MATVLIAALVTFSLMFGVMVLLGFLVAHPWIVVLASAYILWRLEVKPWLCSRMTQSS